MQAGGTAESRLFQTVKKKYLTHKSVCCEKG